MYKKIFTAFFLSAISLSSYADIRLTNNTKVPGTGYLKAISSTECSSKFGDKGILKPNSTMNLGDKVFKSYCGYLSCKAYVYMTKDCGESGGRRVATVKINAQKGKLESVDNLDPDHFRIVWDAKNATISPA